MSQECDSKTKLELAFDSQHPAYNDVMLKTRFRKEKNALIPGSLTIVCTAH